MALWEDTALLREACRNKQMQYMQSPPRLLLAIFSFLQNVRS